MVVVLIFGFRPKYDPGQLDWFMKPLFITTLKKLILKLFLSVKEVSDMAFWSTWRKPIKLSNNKKKKNPRHCGMTSAPCETFSKCKDVLHPQSFRKAHWLHRVNFIMQHMSLQLIYHHGLVRFSFMYLFIFIFHE